MAQAKPYTIVDVGTSLWPTNATDYSNLRDQVVTACSTRSLNIAPEIGVEQEQRWLGPARGNLHDFSAGRNLRVVGTSGAAKTYGTQFLSSTRQCLESVFQEAPAQTGLHEDQQIKLSRDAKIARSKSNLAIVAVIESNKEALVCLGPEATTALAQNEPNHPSSMPAEGMDLTLI